MIQWHCPNSHTNSGACPMPVVAVTITSSTVAYTATCKECNEWHQTYKMKRNADTSMLSHRITQHGHSRKEISYANHTMPQGTLRAVAMRA